MLIAKIIRFLAVVIWVGGIIFFAFILAPTAFKVLPTTREAGLIVGASLKAFDIAALACGVSFLAASAWIKVGSPTKTIGSPPAQVVLVASMLAATAYLHWGLLPRMEAVRVAAAGDLSSLSVASPIRRDFDHLHRTSEQLEGCILLLGVAVVVFIAREP